MFIKPGKPTQNAYIEQFNRTVRHEWLDDHLFDSVDHAQQNEQPIIIFFLQLMNDNPPGQAYLL